ncbi:DNA translocase FtsK [Candidatus Parcubacteria bacterium]|jgi:S-DNA-T family DNA segregation ATPase FtsK/SpoIIIE|nr:MAG: DNA translocase FtsK [Candidatus Parcubacteria bacterium]
MAQKKQKKKMKGKVGEKNETQRRQKNNNGYTPKIDLHPDIRRYVFVIIFFGIALLFILASAHQAGPVGEFFYSLFFKLFGWGYFLLPIVSIILAFAFLSPDDKEFFGLPLLGGLAFVLFSLGCMDLVVEQSGGWVGNFIGMLEKPFGLTAAIIITLIGIIISFLITLNRPLHIFSFFKKEDEEETDEEESTPLKINLPIETPREEPIKDEIKKPERAEKKKQEEEAIRDAEGAAFDVPKMSSQKVIKNYTPPPIDLLTSTVEKPTIGDLRANANIIKRTLESFGIPVEMGEINVGPTVTRYTLKPAEGVKITKITTLNQDLALALAAHPIRIEAPIPGKSLVGIEVPNKSAAIVRLGSLLLYPEFQKSEGLAFALGRNVNGEPMFPSITKMPHMLVAGSTGSGKSISIHTILVSLLYKNSPDMLKLILIDPKRVELSIYNNLPHLIAPVVTENKKAIGALRWVIQEMDNRYQTLLEAGSRDIKSYNKSASEPLPFILIVIDELADLMQTYGREVEGSIIRLAQMARATGIHMVVSTQRPSVEVITGLIKANITTRVALQVASQIDSRTILDTAGAEKLLGRGDLLYLASDSPKPRRLQGAFITEEEIKKVVQFIIQNNDVSVSGVSIENSAEPEATHVFESFGSNSDDDELLEEAIEVVRSAGKASASLLQRRLKVGYARAARLLDIMEERGIIGPGDGAKPREILIDTNESPREDI